MRPYLMLHATLVASLASTHQTAYGQCGGIGWPGATTCVSGYSCTILNSYYSQCIPGIGRATARPISTAKATPTTGSTTTARTTLSKITVKPASSAAKSRSTPAPTVSGKVRFAGVNIAGFDFGCDISGKCIIAGGFGTYPPLLPGGSDGPGQMSHFVKDNNMNIFRLPTSWQYVTGGVLGGKLNAGNIAKYGQLVQGCLDTGAYCIIDVHNYGRWNGGIIGQGGPTNTQFANLWGQIATKYASQPKVVFGIMNEPHDIPDIAAWARPVQAAVTAIRKAGAKNHMCLLPGNNYTSAAAFIPNGSATALMAVKNLDGTNTNLIFDIHQYLDSDNSGTHLECVRNNIDTAFAPLAKFLRANGRRAILSETGGGNVASCVKYMCQQVAYLNSNSDVYLGYTGWGAGNFATDYALSLTPIRSNGKWTDQLLVSSCFTR